MRATLNIDDDVLIAVKEVAAGESKPAGVVVSDLRRRSLARGGRVTSDNVSLPEARSVDWGRIVGSTQIPGVHLLALAMEHRGRSLPSTHAWRQMSPAAVTSALA